MSEGTDKCSSSVCTFRHTLVGIAHKLTTFRIPPFVPVRCEKYGMLYARMFYRQYLSDFMADSHHWGKPFQEWNAEKSQMGESARKLSGRCSLRFLLAHPKKGSPNDEAVSQKVTKREIDGKTWLLFQLSPVLTADGCHWGMSVKEWQQGSEQGFLLATPLPYYSLRLVPWVWYGIKDSTNERAVSRDTWWKWWGKPFLIEMTTEIHGIANQKETKW